METTATELKNRIYAKAHALGANLVGACAVTAWEEEPLQPPEFWPRRNWPWVENVIVLGIPLFAPVLNTTPSMINQELYTTSNRILDDMGYWLTNFIVTELNYRALFFPRDCYYDLNVLIKNPNAAFSHVLAGYYAGLGTIGDSHNLITREFGPRARFVSVLTDAPVAPDEKTEKNLCIHCRRCLKACPAECLAEEGSDIYRMDKVACAEYHAKIKKESHWPCGVCISVCPVGEDLKLYRGVAPVSREGIQHCQTYGSRRPNDGAGR